MNNQKPQMLELSVHTHPEIIHQIQINVLKFSSVSNIFSPIGANINYVEHWNKSGHKCKE